MFDSAIPPSAVENGSKSLRDLVISINESNFIYGKVSRCSTYLFLDRNVVRFLDGVSESPRVRINIASLMSEVCDIVSDCLHQSQLYIMIDRLESPSVSLQVAATAYKILEGQLVTSEQTEDTFIKQVDGYEWLIVSCSL
ncbi:hypothetical protein G9P44_005589 [Scheffersomyces stipitis]|nr:hypothetical protein G9P44_005589 [Scheffersomyces stipitis]